MNFRTPLPFFLGIIFMSGVSSAELPQPSKGWQNAKAALCEKQTGEQFFINFPDIKLVPDQWGSFDIRFGDVCYGVRDKSDPDFVNKEFKSNLTGSYHLGSGYVLQLFEQNSKPVAFLKSKRGDTGAAAMGVAYDINKPTNPINNGDMQCLLYQDVVAECP